MSIITTTPTNLRRPGAFAEFKFVPSGGQLVPLPLRVVIVAEKSSAGTAVLETPVQVFDEDDADTKSGKGSFGALGVRAALKAGKLAGNTPEVWICPIAEPGGGTAAAETITITVTTAVAGNLTVNIADVPITVGVSAGDTPTIIALALKNAIDTNKALLPITAGVSVGVITCTNVTKGTNGNDVAYALVEAPSGVSVALAQSVAGAGVASITNAVNALYDRRYHAIATSNHTTTDAATMLLALADAWSYSQKNYRWFFMGERGSLGTAQTLQAACNDKGIIIINCEQIAALPVCLAAGGAVAEFSQIAPNANLDGALLPFAPPTGAYAFTAAEVESALNGGVTPLTPEGSFVKIERLITTSTTVNSAPFEPLRDIAYSRTAAFRAEQLDIKFRAGFRQETLTAEVLDRIRDMIIANDREMESLGYLEHVDDLIGQIKVEKSTSPVGRVVSAAPFDVVDPLHQGVFQNIMYF